MGKIVKNNNDSDVNINFATSAKQFPLRLKKFLFKNGKINVLSVVIICLIIASITLAIVLPVVLITGHDNVILNYNNAEIEFVISDGEITTAYVPKFTGYTFMGWYLDENYNKELNLKNYKALDVDGQTVQIFAKWKSNIIQSADSSPVLVSAHTHTYEIIKIVQPTCSEDGYIEYGCECGEHYFVVLKKTGIHTYSDWSVTKPATIYEDGEKVRYCTGCGNMETAVISKLAYSVKISEQEGIEQNITVSDGILSEMNQAGILYSIANGDDMTRDRVFCYKISGSVMLSDNLFSQEWFGVDNIPILGLEITPTLTSVVSCKINDLNGEAITYDDYYGEALIQIETGKGFYVDFYDENDIIVETAVFYTLSESFRTEATITSLDELLTALSGEADFINIDTDLIIANDMLVGDGYTLNILSGKVFTVNEGVTLTLNGQASIKNEGAVNIFGTLYTQNRENGIKPGAGYYRFNYTGIYKYDVGETTESLINGNIIFINLGSLQFAKNSGNGFDIIINSGSNIAVSFPNHKDSQNPDTYLLGANDSLIIESGATLDINYNARVQGQVYIQGAVNIAVGKTLTVVNINSGETVGEITVDESGSLTNNGTIINYGIIIGTISGTGTVSNP